MKVYVLVDIHNDLAVLGVFTTVLAAQRHQSVCRHYPTGVASEWSKHGDEWVDRDGGRVIFECVVQVEG